MDSEKHDRCERVVALYGEGKNLREIGIEVGKSHEWVRQTLQLLSVALRPRRKEPDKKLIAKKRAAKRAKFKSKWGMSPEKMAEIVSEFGKGDDSPKSKFWQQRSSARGRGIAWEFSFASWWKVWSESGKWMQRGRSGYVMGRKKDEGPYSPDNVEIITSKQNGLDCTINRPWALRNYKQGRSRRALSDDQVREIRVSTDSQRVIAAKFGLDQSHVCLIRNRKSYKDVQDINHQGE